MAIEVTCPGCQKRFKVSDQFAGKKGPCPQCKTVITIPEKGPEVIIHAPDTEGPKDSSGRPVLRPLRRKETKLTGALIGGIVGGILAAVVGAAVVRIAFPVGQDGPSVGRQIVLALGALVLGPPLVLGGYAFLRDQELEPHRGRSLWLRVGICTAVYAIIWGAYAFVPPAMNIDLEAWVLLLIVPFMVVVGALTAYAALDLTIGSAAMHYGLYLIATIVLCLVAGVQLFEMTTPSRVPPRKRNPRAASVIVLPMQQVVVAVR
jgi:hypothetical protein